MGGWNEGEELGVVGQVICIHTKTAEDPGRSGMREGSGVSASVGLCVTRDKGRGAFCPFCRVPAFQGSHPEVRCPQSQAGCLRAEHSERGLLCSRGGQDGSLEWQGDIPFRSQESPTRG